MLENLHYYRLATYSGKENMAFDEVIASALANSKSYAFLRFYKWRPYCLSFGYNQPVEKLVDMEVAKKIGINMVRRASGGKMVFHADEITFSMGAPIEFLQKKAKDKTFLSMFKLLVDPVVLGLQELGLDAEFAAPEKSLDSGSRAHCYAVAAGHSIFMNGKKLVGAAGIAKRDCLTVHGSIPCSLIAPPEEIFFNKDSAGRNLKISSLSDCLSQNEIARLPDLIAKNFSEKFELILTEREVSAEDRELIEELSEKKYSDLHWRA